GPDVKLEERAVDAEPVRAVDELERLALEHRRDAVVGRQPVRRVEHDVLDAYEPQSITGRLVDQRLRTRGVDLAVAYQGVVDVVAPHGAVVRAADAAEERVVLGMGRGVDVEERPRGVAYDFDQPGRRAVLVFGSIGEKRGSADESARPRYTEDGPGRCADDRRESRGHGSSLRLRLARVLPLARAGSESKLPPPPAIDHGGRLKNALSHMNPQALGNAWFVRGGDAAVEWLGAFSSRP